MSQTRIEQTDAALSEVWKKTYWHETEDTEAEVDSPEADELGQEDEDELLEEDNGEDGLADGKSALYDVLREDEYMSERLQQLLECAEDLLENNLEDPEFLELSQERSRLKTLVDNLQETIIERIPPVIHFRSFEDELPDSISLDGKRCCLIL